MEHPHQQADSPLKIENEHYLIEVAPTNGAIVRISDKAGSLELITEPAIADNFRIWMALPGFQAAYILGKDQRLTAVERDDSAITLTWDGPTAKHSSSRREVRHCNREVGGREKSVSKDPRTVNRSLRADGAIHITAGRRARPHFGWKAAPYTRRRTSSNGVGVRGRH